MADVMQYIQQGSNKRVVFLSQEQSIIYLRNQVLDIMHDAKIGKVEQLYVDSIAALIAHWIVHVNNLDMHAEHEIVLAISDNFAPFIGKSVEDVAPIIMSYAPIAEKRDAMVNIKRIINDNCVHQTRRCVTTRGSVGALCDMREIATFSTLFDRGSYTNTCGGRQTFIGLDIGVPYAFWRQDIAYKFIGALDQTTDFLAPISFDYRSFSNALVIQCAAQFSQPDDVTRVIAADARDLCIAGRLPCPHVRGPIVLAYRGFSAEQIPDGTGDWACQYTQFYDGSHATISRATSQASKITASVVICWINLVARLRINASNVAEIASDEALRAYAEVSAKHWGDLGMIIDAAREPDIIMITSDKMAQVLCMQFGAICANCAQGGAQVQRADIMIPRAISGVRIANFTNTADIFLTLGSIFPADI